MESEHKTHHAQPADRFVRGIGDIAVFTSDRAQRKGWQVLVVLSALLILFGLIVLVNPWWDSPDKLFDVIGGMLLFSSLVGIVRLIFIWPLKSE